VKVYPKNFLLTNAMHSGRSGYSWGTYIAFTKTSMILTSMRWYYEDLIR